MLTRRFFTASALFAPFAPSRARAAPPSAKFALVVANSDYDGDGKVDATEAGAMRARSAGFAPDLANPWFDSVRVGEALQEAGFKVETFYNADRGMISGAVQQLRARAASAGPTAATVFYYAGHGLQFGGRNYLVGTRARIGDLPTETSQDRDRLGFASGVSLQMLLAGARTPQGPGYDLMLLDCCRDNPWEDSVRAAAEARGEKYVGERYYGALSVGRPRSVLGFSAQPGQQAQDGLAAASSPFANAIARRARQIGLAIDKLLQDAMGEVAAATGAKQIPWVSGRLGDATSLSD
jgi:uncharacterized caspase-like protein